MLDDERDVSHGLPDLAGAVLFLGPSQMFEICPGGGVKPLARPQSLLKIS